MNVMRWLLNSDRSIRWQAMRDLTDVGDLEEETLLTADAFEILKQLVLDAAFGSRVDAVDRFDQQVDQVIGDRTATDDSERCKPGQPRTFGVPGAVRAVPRR